MHWLKYSLFTVECKARFTSASVAADMEVEIEVYLQIQCPFPVRFSKVSISLNHQVSQYFCFPLSETGSTPAHTNLLPFARCTLGLNRHFY